VNQSIPRPGRTFITASVLILLALVAFAVANGLSHHGRDRGFVRMMPAAHAQFIPNARGPRTGGGGFAVGRMGGGGGTITAINGSTLTLRTMAGTETVNTSGSTTYMKDRQTITFGDLKVGDVVHVVPTAGAARPATPGTGTVDASRIVVVEPMLMGRVSSVDGDTVNLVGRDGQMLTVTLTDSTKYFNGAQSADRSAITAGSRILAAGSQDSVTHLTASVVTVLPANAHPMWRGRGAGRFGGKGGPGGPGGVGGASGPGFGPRGFGA
jgi:hypothetical protein